MSLSFPATAGQRRLWLMDQLVPGGNPALNMPLAARLTGRLDVGALRRSFNEIVRRHEVLRTTFYCEKGQLQQLISPELTLPVPVVNVDDYPAAERSGVPEHLMLDEAGQPFDLARGPVVRARLVRLHPEEHLLLITIHQAVSDGWSNGVLLRELGQLYAAFVQNVPSPLPPLPIQFADFAQWQHDQAEAAVGDDPMAYWREVLAGELPVLDLPVDRPRRVARGRAAAGGVRRTVLAPALVQTLRAVATGEGVSAFMLYLAAFTVLLSRYSGGQEDVLLNTPSANRDRSELEALIGLFLNPLLLRVDLSGNPTFRELLGRTRRVVLGAFEHSGAPFEQLIEELQPRRLQANFQYQSSFLQPMRLPSLDLAPMEPSVGVSIAEWSGAVIDYGDQTKFALEYNADLCDAATIDRALAGYQRVLEAIAASGGLDLPISRLPVEAAAGENAACVLLADRWRLPAESVRWMDRCFVTGTAARDGEFGRSKPGVEILVLDNHLQAAPVGVVGAVYVSGLPETPGQASPEFVRVEHPEKGHLWKTGDLARRVGSDRLQWMGRAGQEGRVDGLRVDTGVIEKALQSHPHVEKAVVRWSGPRDGGKRRLIAFFQSDGAPPALVSHTGSCETSCGKRLPEDLDPGGVRAAGAVPAHPRWPARRAAALPEPSAQCPRRSDGSEKYDDAVPDHPSSDHRDLARAAPRVTSIGIRDDFFALGGNSLLAMRMLYRVEQACGKALLPATLFQQATVEHLAGEILRQERRARPRRDVVRICETGAKPPIFYLHGDHDRRRLLLHEALAPPRPGPAVLTRMPPLARRRRARNHADPRGTWRRRHLTTVRAVRPHGPYVVGGFCVGRPDRAGTLATAARGGQGERGRAAPDHRRDLAAGPPPGDRFRRLARTLGPLPRLGRRPAAQRTSAAGTFSRRAWTGGWPSTGASNGQIFRRRLGRRLGHRLWRSVPAQQAGGGPAIGGPRQPRPDDGPGHGSTPAGTRRCSISGPWAGYAAQPYAGPTTLLLSHDLVRRRARPSRHASGKSIIPRLESRELVGSHLACITEHADALAETVRASLPGTARPDQDAPSAGRPWRQDAS